MAVRSPWLKGAIERFFRSIAQGLVHPLPGSTLSNVLQLGEYDPAKDACITLGAFTELLHVFLLDDYAQRWHKGKKGVPAQLWHESVQSGFAPALHHSASELRILMGRVDERTIQRTGIDFENLRYQSPDLFRLRARLPKGAKVKFKYDPKDVGTLHVLDTTEPGGTRWLPVLAIDGEYAHGLPLKTHRLLHELFVQQRGRSQADLWTRAEVKRHVRDLVAREFSLTRKLGKRKRLARHLLGMDGQDQAQIESARARPKQGQPPPMLLPAAPPAPSTAAPHKVPGGTGASATQRGRQKHDRGSAATANPEAAVSDRLPLPLPLRSKPDASRETEGEESISVRDTLDTTQPFSIDDFEYESEAWGSGYDLPALQPKDKDQANRDLRTG